jgi:hypothetical protein
MYYQEICFLPIQTKTDCNLANLSISYQFRLYSHYNEIAIVVSFIEHQTGFAYGFAYVRISDTLNLNKVLQIPFKSSLNREPQEVLLFKKTELDQHKSGRREVQRKDVAGFITNGHQASTR